MVVAVAAVRAYFLCFTARWPDVTALASAADADVMGEWAGLGYYARARNLLACARAVAGDKKVIAVVQPHRYTRLRDLMTEFSTCFSDADTVIVADVYTAG